MRAISAARLQRYATFCPVLPMMLSPGRSAITAMPTLCRVCLCNVMSKRQNLMLLVTSHDGDLLRGLRVVIPPKFREAVLKELHTGHQCIVKTKQVARSFVWWPCIDSAIERLICSCQGCAKTQSNPSKAQLHPCEWPSQPWERIHTDFDGPFMNSMWLIIVDAHSKWPEVLRMSSTTSSKLISTLSEVFSRFGLPIELVSDNGPQLTSSQF